MLEIDVELVRGGFRRTLRIVEDARVVALAGPSGAGKTSVLHAIAGLLRPRAGRIEVRKAPVDHLALCVQRERHVRRAGLREGGERAGFGRGERVGADIVARRWPCVALRKFDLLRFLPVRRVLEIEVRALKIGLPAVGEGDRRVIARDFARARSFALTEPAKHEIDAVGVHERHEAHAVFAQQARGVEPGDAPARLRGGKKIVHEL